MSSDLLDIYLLALLSLLNPSLLAAVTVMLLLPSPKRLMFGYLLRAYMTSITAGLVRVSPRHGCGGGDTSKPTAGPLEEIVAGRRGLRCALVLGPGGAQPVRERR